MRSFIFIIYLGTLHIKTYSGLNLIDIPLKSNESSESQSEYSEVSSKESLLTKTAKDLRRYYQRSNDDHDENDEDKDNNIKSKIAILVEQALFDTDRKLKSVDHIKNEHKEKAPYKIGFILSMVKRSKDVLNELFNVAIKHKEDWKALEQLKVFELIVHTNVDTTNLVRQLVEIHISHSNSTSPEMKKRVVVFK